MNQKIYFTPGPSQLFYSVKYDLQTALKENVPSISHRSDAFKKIYQSTCENLKDVLGLPDGYHILFTSSANEIWERIIQNLVEESSHHFINGAFSKKFLSFSKDYQKEATATIVPDGEEFVDHELPIEAELIALTLNETSIGYQMTEDFIKTIRDKYPNKLIAIDGVSAFPSIKLDFNQVDTAYFSVQKCFGLPAGLGVWIVNDRCISKASEIESKRKITGSYHRLQNMVKIGEAYQTPETPNVLGIYLLGKVCEAMLQRGINAIRNETTYKSTLLYQTLEKKGFIPFIKNKPNRSKTVMVVENHQKDLLSQANKKGWVLGSGYGNYKSNHVRIANFPTHSKEQIELLVDFIDKNF